MPHRLFALSNAASLTALLSYPFLVEPNMTITRMSIQSTLVAFAIALFVCCMVCHGELARLKPHPRHLTGFYVIVSLGGAAGGLFVGLAAPNFFRAYYEFPLGLALCAALSVLVFARNVPWCPVTYFCPQSGIGLAMTALEGAPRRIGILGLGCGTLAAYGRSSDVLRIYEIKQQVVDIANTQFSFLRETAARAWSCGHARISTSGQTTSPICSGF